MSAKETRDVIAALTAKGARVRFVGGCVRDALLGRAVKDVDIATHDDPETVTALLKAAGIRAIPTGIAHGTVTAVTGAAHFEITTLREDVETDGRRAKVAFTDDWEADAARRDFTFNAIFCAPDGTIYDRFGGIEDLKAGRVRFVGDAETRLKEDVLRLLRFFRFHAWYGRGLPDPKGLDACRKFAHLLPNLSGERVAAETLRLLGAEDPSPVFALMRQEGILTHFLPEAQNIARLTALVALERGYGEADPLRRLAAVLDVTAAGAQGVAFGQTAQATDEISAQISTIQNEIGYVKSMINTAYKHKKVGIRVKEAPAGSSSRMPTANAWSRSPLPRRRSRSPMIRSSGAARFMRWAPRATATSR